ncbi:hypothetical protein Nepgr_006087 [Nepenthes gracilis]|uniref:Mitochondrial glycoprotein n=1 Tax=Nepenthes gracilis TaxID=150966 RepID=A0AAD3S4I2_NEPGR|nr:hypothetical protein Nepgr_006087 [Nepenthes gracilis]
MAFSRVFRRSASIAVPLAGRLIGGQRHRHTAAAFSVIKGGSVSPQARPSTNYSGCRYLTNRPSSDQSLLAVIESEIKCAEETEEHNQVEEVPDEFPFKIEDNPGQQTITLTREFHGETIVVEVTVPNLDAGEEDNEDDKDDGEGTASQSSLPLIVSVSKKDGPFLEFGCTAFPDEIAIDSLSLKNPASPDDQIAYEGPDFTDLDENLQKAFHKFLEIRGIKPSTTNFLHEYMINKDGKEYLRWLNNLKKFIEV